MGRTSNEDEHFVQVVAGAMGVPVDALWFVLSAWSESEWFEQVHIESDELCWRLHDIAVANYGTDAREQLAAWGIRSTADIGQVIAGMAEHGLMSIRGDDLEGFVDVFQFEDEFRLPERVEEKPAKQVTLTFLFVVTTVGAVLASGFSKSGFGGMMPALLSSWFAFLGFACILSAISSGERGWLILLLIGSLMFVVGVFSFLSFEHLNLLYR